MANNETTSTQRFGWTHSGVLTLAAVGVAWLFGYYALRSPDLDVPKIGRIDFIADLGPANWVIGFGFLVAAVLVSRMSTAPWPNGLRRAIPVLIALGALWLLGYLFYRAESLGVPFVGRIDPLADLGTWNIVIGLALIGAGVLIGSRTLPEPGTTGNRWAAPAMIASAVFGLVWIVIFYTLGNSTADVPVLSDVVYEFGNWNLVVGMGFIIAAFGFAMKWE